MGGRTIRGAGAVARMVRPHALAALAAVLLFGAAPVRAAPFTFSALFGNLSASVKIEASGNNLVVTLTNTSTADVTVPTQVLTAVFWDMIGAMPSLSPANAVISAASVVTNGPVPPTDPGGVVGGEWAFRDDLNPASDPFREFGISSAGFGLFGPGDRFPGTDLDGPADPNGLNYGISSAGDDPSTHNGGADRPLIQNEVVFTLSSAGLPPGFDPETAIHSVVFQYGTGLDETHFPEPATLSLLAVGALLARRGRRA